jgi:hypothetical protein
MTKAFTKHSCQLSTFQIISTFVTVAQQLQNLFQVIRNLGVLAALEGFMLPSALLVIPSRNWNLTYGILIKTEQIRMNETRTAEIFFPNGISRLPDC